MIDGERSREHDAICSDLQRERARWKPSLPCVFRSRCLELKVKKDGVVGVDSSCEVIEELQKLFPCTSSRDYGVLVESRESPVERKPLKVGVVLSGGQAPGGHNVIAGLFDFIKSQHSESKLLGFLGGPQGIYKNEFKEIDSRTVDFYRNQGGFHMLGSGRHKIESKEHKLASLRVCNNLGLDGLVIIGGDDSNTNAALLAEFFQAHHSRVTVVGVPKTIDGDLKNDAVEVSFGFDTATKTYSERIGNLAAKTLTTKDSYHFVRLMGRAASNIALECALQTRPNLCVIGEEVKAKNLSLQSIVDEISDLVVKRAANGMHFGIILVPEGLIEFIPEVGRLIDEINDNFGKTKKLLDISKLSAPSQSCFKKLPQKIKDQLLLDRDPHGNIQVSRIETEKLLILMTQSKLEKSSCGNYKFKAKPHFFGYEARCALPSVFDCNYCYALGHTAGALIQCRATGYMAVVRGLDNAVEDWEPAGCSLQSMMTMEKRHGQPTPVIKKYLVDLQGCLFKTFELMRDQWKYGNFYRNPGPLQFNGFSAMAVNGMIRPPKLSELASTSFSECKRFRLNSTIRVPHELRSRKVELVVARADSFLVVGENEGSAAISEGQTRIGVVLAEHEAPGVSNVLLGLLERLESRFPEARHTLHGFKGTNGLLSRDYTMLSRSDLWAAYNCEGFSMLGRTPDTEDSWGNAENVLRISETCRELNLNGLVLIGGLEAIRNGASIAKGFAQTGSSTSVVVVPASADLCLCSRGFEGSVGFESTCRYYSSLVGNILIDAVSAAKYWNFIAIEAATDMVLEAALQTSPNLVIIPEKLALQGCPVTELVTGIADVVQSRAAKGVNFGGVLLSTRFFWELDAVKAFLARIREAGNSKQLAQVAEMLLDPGSSGNGVGPAERDLLVTLSPAMKEELKRCLAAHETSYQSVKDFFEKSADVLSQLVLQEIEKRQKLGVSSIKGFSPLCHYLESEAFCAMPSDGDATLGVLHGYLACIAIESRIPSVITGLHKGSEERREWELGCKPLVASLCRPLAGKVADEPSVFPRKTLLLLEDTKQKRCYEDLFRNPGPIQFDLGPDAKPEGLNCLAKSATAYLHHHDSTSENALLKWAV